ncbi:hypothetical protein CENTIMANUS_00295 [Klebsiella phage vB_KpM_Centimanus]
MKSTEPSKIAEVIKSFVSSPMALDAIQKHRNSEKEAIERLKAEVCKISRDEIEKIVALISSGVEYHTVPEGFSVHNVSADNVRFEYNVETDGIETQASIDDDADLIVRIMLNENKSKELMKNICGCIKARFNVNEEIRAALDVIYPPESKVILVIEGASFGFDNSYGG